MVRERAPPPAKEKADGDRFDLPRGALGIAFRIGIEMVAAMIFGVGAGLLIDRALGSAPFGLIGMFMLGVTGGALNVWRALGGMGLGLGYRNQSGSDDKSV
ncbi:ATP synthase protein I [uncultured Gammaproteobacteria bacterium]